jgi:hypothetical protein
MALIAMNQYYICGIVWQLRIVCFASQGLRGVVVGLKWSIFGLHCPRSGELAFIMHRQEADSHHVSASGLPEMRKNHEKGLEPGRNA